MVVSKSEILVDDENFTERPVDFEGLKLRVIKLANGVKAVLTSDQFTTQSGLTIRVDHGMFNDPEEFQGLAHFVEHLTTKGSEKYPDENEYDSFIAGNGGIRNATTKEGSTVYYHTVNNDNFENSVDILSQIAIAPLFKVDLVKREVLAVDSEYKMQKNEPFFASMHITKLMIDQSHPITKFGWGNLESLRGNRNDEEMANAAKIFHEKFYGPQNLKVALYGNASLDELQTMAETYFGDLEMRNTEPELVVSTPAKIDAENISAIYIIPNKDISTMSFTWMFKEETPKLGKLLCSILSNRNEGTLFNLLKEKNLIMDSAASISSRFGGTIRLVLTFDLTDLGVEKNTEIIEIVDQYLQFLKSNAIPEYIFDEMKISSKLAFKARNRGKIYDFCNNIAYSLHKFPANKLLTNGIDFEDYSIEKEKTFIDSLDLKNCIIIVTSLKFDDEKFQINKVEKYTQARYAVKNVDLNKATNYIPAFKFPEKNKYLSDKFDVKFVDEYRPNFESFELKKLNTDGIHHSSVIETKYRKELVFTDIRLRNFGIPNSAENVLALKTVIKYLNDYVDTKFYDANLSRILFEFATIKQGVKIHVSMPPSKILETSFLKDFLNEFFTFKPDRPKLEPFADKMVQNTKNLLSTKPFSAARHNYLDIVRNDVPVCDLIKNVETIHTADYDTLLQSYFHGLSIDVLTFGTHDHEYGTLIVDELKSVLRSNKINFSNHGSRSNFNLVMPSKNFKIESTLVSANDKLNNAINLSIPFDRKSIKDALAVRIYSKFFKASFFDNLRTKQNFGYVVAHIYLDEPEMLSLDFIIQSEKSCKEIREAILKFIHESLPILRNKSESEWSECLDAIKNSLLNDQKSIYSDFSTLQSNNYKSKYNLTKDNFDYGANLVQGLQSITKDEVINVIESNIKNEIERLIVVKCLKSE